MKNKIDLHVHTTASDGTLTPFEVIDEAYKNGIKLLSITDHDSLNAYTDDLIDYAKRKDITLITGIEISTKINKCGIHVLGYNIDIHNKELLNKIAKLQNSRHNYLINVSNKLETLGYKVNTKKLDKIDAVTKAHIALDVIENEYNKNILIKTFSQIPSKGLFIETIMNEGCPAYVKKESITPKQASELIKNAGGTVVLAHPVSYFYEDNLEEKDIKKIIDDMNADGIESYYIYVDKNNIKHNDIQKWYKFAKDNDKFITIGSDFHSFDNIHPIIGLTSENINIEDDDIKVLIRKIKR